MTPKVFIRTSVVVTHSFRSSAFWAPFCVRCHEKFEHPVHRGGSFEVPEYQEVCGYDPCTYCGAREDPDGGVSLRGE